MLCLVTPTVEGVGIRGTSTGSHDRKEHCVLNHGLWCGVPDIDAETQIALGPHPGFTLIDQIIPRAQFFAMCGMNLAFRRVMLPAMYFLLMGPTWSFDRFGDIWCGLFAKAVADHLGFAVHSGAPYVVHERASDAKVNLKKEAPGYVVNEWLWRTIDRHTFWPTANRSGLLFTNRRHFARRAVLEKFAASHDSLGAIGTGRSSTFIFQPMKVAVFFSDNHYASWSLSWALGERFVHWA